MSENPTGDALYRNALKRRQQLVDEIERIDVFLGVYADLSGMSDPPGEERQSGLFTLSLGNDTPIPVSPTLAQAEKSPQSEGPHDPPAVIVQKSKEILREYGRPLTRGQLAKKLIDEGVIIGGGDKSKVLGTTLWRAKDDIVSLKGFGYWPKDMDYPVAGYRPSVQSGFGRIMTRRAVDQNSNESET